MSNTLPHKNSKKLLLFIVLVLAFVGCIIAMLPQPLELIINFAQNLIHRQLRKPEKWMTVVTVCSHVGIYFIFIIAFLNFTKFGAKIIENAKIVFSNFFAELKKKDSIFNLAIIAVFLLFYFYRVMDSDFLYSDDVFRHVTGSRSWIEFSRYVSEFVSILFHTGIKLSDIAPLPQIFAIIFMVLTISMLSYILNEKISLPLMFALSVIFINPLFSQCICYRYDAPYMTLAILFPTIPFLFCKDESQENSVFAFMSFFFLILCNMTYQASASVYIILAINQVYKRFQNKSDTKHTLLFMTTCILSFAAALLLFKFALMIPQSDQYFSAKPSIKAIGKNAATYLKSSFTLFGGKWTQCFFLAIIAASFVVQAKKSKQKRIVSILLTLTTFVLSLVFSYGAYLIFEHPLFTPRAYTGFGFLAGMFCANIFLCSQKKLVRALVIGLMFGCIVFYYAFGNALRDQRIYQEFRTEILLSDLNKFADNSSKKNVEISGSIGHSQGFASAAKTFPIIKFITSSLPGGGATWNDEILNFYNFNCTDEIVTSDMPLLLSTNYHDIYGSGNDFYVVLK